MLVMMAIIITVTDDLLRHEWLASEFGALLLCAAGPPGG